MKHDEALAFAKHLLNVFERRHVIIDSEGGPINLDDEVTKYLTPKHCKQCNSPRKDVVCFKCGVDTVDTHPEWDHPTLPDVEPYREAAREVGYCVSVHGTQERDLDLVAVAWTDDAVEPETLIEHLLHRTGSRQCGTIEDKPHGRKAVCMKPEGWYRMIDLSVVKSK